jgi:hypothetical protein
MASPTGFLLGLRFRFCTLCGRRGLVRLPLALLVPRELRLAHRPKLVNSWRGMLAHLGLHQDGSLRVRRKVILPQMQDLITRLGVRITDLEEEGYEFEARNEGSD